MNLDPKDLQTLVVFAVMALGVLLGRVRVGMLRIGVTTGVLAVALAFGHLGFEARADLGGVGFALFIFFVGLQAGPSFFGAVRTDGVRYLVLTAVVAGTGALLALLFGALLDLEHGMHAGLLAGALTSTPTLVGAQDAVASGLARLPEGLSAEAAAANVGVGYAVTYLLGTALTILVFQQLPRAARLDLSQASRDFARERGFGGRPELAHDPDRLPIVRAYNVPDELAGRTIADLRTERAPHVHALRIRRAGEVLEASDALRLERGDVLSLIASLAEHDRRPEHLGQEVLDPELLAYDTATYDVVVTRRAAAKRTLAELAIPGRYGCFVRAHRRATVLLPLDGTVRVQPGDVLSVTGEPSRLRALAAEVGSIEAHEKETDLLMLAAGLALGVLLGGLAVTVGGVTIRAGTAGGMLVAGVLLGLARTRFPLIGGVPAAAAAALGELGLALFVAGVGLRAGAGFAEALGSAGPALLLAGLAVTVTPVLVGYAFGRRVLRMNPALLLGALTGAVTSTGSLRFVSRAAASGVPDLGYAGTYTVANVALTLVGAILMAL